MLEIHRTMSKLYPLVMQASAALSVSTRWSAWDGPSLQFNRVCVPLLGIKGKCLPFYLQAFHLNCICSRWHFFICEGFRSPISIHCISMASKKNRVYRYNGKNQTFALNQVRYFKIYVTEVGKGFNLSDDAP